MNKKMRYGIGTGVMAVALAVGSVAWACTPPNGVTKIWGQSAGETPDNCIEGSLGQCTYVRGGKVVAYAKDTFSQGLPADANWKLFIGTAGKWCMAEYDLVSIAGPFTRVDNVATGNRVPSYDLDANGTPDPAEGFVPTTWPLGNADICMNNGDGYGNTANPQGVTIVRKL